MSGRTHGEGETAPRYPGAAHVLPERSGGADVAEATPFVVPPQRAPELLQLLRRVASDDLREVEQAIRMEVQKAARARAAICVALARIKRLQLYRQAGFSSFKAYLREQRIGLAYHTAHEYARIGEIIHAHHEELQAVRFEEETGLKKLLLLDRALRRNGAGRAAVFAKLKEASFREFRQYAYAGQSARADCQPLPSPGEALPGIQLDRTGECIVVGSPGREIIWFDTDLDRCLPSAGLARAFRLHILEAVRHFFISGQPADKDQTSAHRG